MLWDMSAQPWGEVYKYKDKNPSRMYIRFITFTSSRLMTHTKEILLNLSWYRNHLLEVSIWKLLVLTLSLVDYDAIIRVLRVWFTGKSNNFTGRCEYVLWFHQVLEAHEFVASFAERKSGYLCLTTKLWLRQIRIMHWFNGLCSCWPTRFVFAKVFSSLIPCEV